MMMHTALFINLMRKQLTSMSNSTIPCKLSRKFQDLLKKDYPVHLQQKNVLENSKDCCEQRLRECGYNEKLNYTEENNKINKKSRKRNILCFNPPYSKSVKTNISKLFLRLINKHFLPTHKYRKIFNRNTINISYSSMPNIKCN